MTTQPLSPEALQKMINTLMPLKLNAFYGQVWSQIQVVFKKLIKNELNIY